MPHTLSALDRADLIDALSDAIDDLSERAHGKYADYEEEDLPEIDAKLDRWNTLIKRLMVRGD